MFKKLHRQMTFFCTLITAAILIAMTFVSLELSTSNIENNAYMSFTKSADSIVANLGMQSTISYEWIARTENDGQYILHILNNGNPLLYDQLRTSDERESLITRAKFLAENSEGFSLDSSSSSVLSDQIDFEMETYNNNYYVSAAVIPKSSGYISIIIIYSLDETESQIQQQRIMFSAIAMIAVCLLGLFSYLFTKRMLQPLVENQEKQSQFIASASHELRTPLAVMLSSLSALRKAEGEDAERFAGAIESEGRQMSRLIDDLLLLANADSHSWSMQTELLELDTILLDVYEKYEPVAAKNHMKLDIRLPEEPLPECRGDRMRMEQLISILIDNALSYTPEKGRIILSSAIKGTRIEVRIADNGPGITDDKKKEIWDRFYRADKSRTVNKSFSQHAAKKHFGLGLNIAKEITRLHKGKIWVQDTPGGGATFVIQIPVFEKH